MAKKEQKTKEKAEKARGPKTPFPDLLKARAHQIFLGAMAVLLLLRLLIFFMESGFTGEPLPIPQETELNDLIKAEDPASAYKQVERILKPMVEFRQSDYWILANFNMFDPKRILEAKRYEERANQIYAEAQTAFDARNDALVLEKVNEALLYQPNHAKAQELRKVIRQRLGLTGVAASTDTLTAQPKPPAPTVAP